MYGTLEVICGPMFAGKSTELLKRILWATTGQNKNVLVLKPSFDTRYSLTEIVSHDGLKTVAHSINEWPAHLIYNEDTNIDNTLVSDIYFIDEIQFFTEPYYKGNIINEIKGLLEHNAKVVVSGLDMDWQGNPFFVTGQLLAMADQVHKLTANCTVSGLPATKTFKKVHSGGSVELGTNDLYEARSNTFWSYR